MIKFDGYDIVPLCWAKSLLDWWENLNLNVNTVAHRVTKSVVEGYLRSLVNCYQRGVAPVVSFCDMDTNDAKEEIRHHYLGTIRQGVGKTLDELLKLNGGASDIRCRCDENDILKTCEVVGERRILLPAKCEMPKGKEGGKFQRCWAGAVPQLPTNVERKMATNNGIKKPPR
ncbi:hypothetical protein FACS1894139_00510 [Planctomycetales bacterium]|nr:hypothetical protein FACS1894139_00510 [Planctomycetales bacterium]